MAPNPPWMDLPQELITTITTFLSSNPLDIINLRSISKSFHSSIPFPSHLLSPFYPLFLPPPPPTLPPPPPPTLPPPPSPPLPLPPPPPPPSSYILIPTSIFLIQPPTPSPSNWVAFFDELNHGRVTIRRPFTCVDFVPPLDFPSKLSLTHFGFRQLGMFYNVCYVDCVNDKFVKKGSWCSNIHKVVVLSDGVGLISLYDDGKLGFLRFGDGCQWRVLGDGEGLKFDDVIEFNGRVLGIDRKARVYEMAIVGCDHMLLELKVVVPAISCGGQRRKRLIESFGCLYLIVWMNVDDCMCEFWVFVMNERVNRWVKVNGIGNRVFLFGLDFSVACDADKFVGSIKGDCVVFYDHSFAGYDSSMHQRFPYMNPGFSDLPVSIYRFETGAKIQPIKSLPSYSSLFWPPPTWIWPSDKLKLSGTFTNAFDRLLKEIVDDELKAKYRQLSSLVGAIVSGDDISQHELLQMLENIEMLQKLLVDIIQVVEKDAKIIRRGIVDEAEARHPKRFIYNLVGTSGLNAEETNGEYEWLSNEISLRIGTHFRLKTFLNGLIGVLDRRNEGKFESVASTVGREDD